MRPFKGTKAKGPLARLRRLLAMPTLERAEHLLGWIPPLCRFFNFNTLDERPRRLTMLAVSAQLLLFVCVTGHFLKAINDVDRLANSFCALFVGVFISITEASSFLQRKRYRRLYLELVQYLKYIKSTANAEQTRALASLPGLVLLLMIGGAVCVWTTWSLYTAAPIIFELARGKAVGSTRRISTPVWPYLCDIKSSPCFEIYYAVVAFIWFWGSMGYLVSECVNYCFYMYISRMFRVLGISLKNVRSDAETSVKNLIKFDGKLGQEHEFLVRTYMHRLINEYICHHQFLIRWSQECVHANIVPVTGMMILVPTAVGLGGLKLMTDKNYVLDEVPFAMGVTIWTTFVQCCFADLLSDASQRVHWDAYTSDWWRSDKDFRMKINFMMMRSIKPVATKNGLIGTVTLVTFVKVLKGSYSFLQAMRAAIKLIK